MPTLHYIPRTSLQRNVFHQNPRDAGVSLQKLAKKDGAHRLCEDGPHHSDELGAIYKPGGEKCPDPGLGNDKTIDKIIDNIQTLKQTGPNSFVHRAVNENETHHVSGLDPKCEPVGGGKSDSSFQLKSVVGRKERGRYKTFFGRIADLKEYKEMNGHTNVSKREDKSLFQFCATVKHARNHPGKATMKLTEDRIASLEAIGFEWAHTQYVTKSFDERIKDLVDFKAKNGHTNVHKSEDRSLAKFVYNARYARNNVDAKTAMKLTKDRIASFDALGFEWRL